MTDTPNAPEGGGDPSRDAARVHPLLELVADWLRRARTAESTRVEATIDRGSFESFPASDPVATATATGERQPGLQAVDCTMRPDRLTFRLAPREAETGRPPPAWTVESEAGDGGRMSLRVWVLDGSEADTPVPAALELEPVHASLRPRGHDRRGGMDRRLAAGPMPAGADRRRGERRSRADGAGGTLARHADRPSPS